MAAHLLKLGYKQPAISLCGAVLEDGLRKCCHRNGISIGVADDIGSLTGKLTGKKVVSELAARNLSVWKKLRDHADHGEFDKLEPVTEAQIMSMIDGASELLDRLP